MNPVNQKLILIEIVLVVITFLVLSRIRYLKWNALKGRYLLFNFLDMALVGTFTFSFAWVSVEIALLLLLHVFFESGSMTLYQSIITCLLLFAWLLLGVVVGFSDRASYGAVVGVMVIAPIGSLFLGIIGFLGGFFAVTVTTPRLITLGRSSEYWPNLLQLPFFIGAVLGTGFIFVSLTGLLPAAAIIGAIAGFLSHILHHFRKKDGITQ